jgi:hypothetical protein
LQQRKPVTLYCVSCSVEGRLATFLSGPSGGSWRALLAILGQPVLLRVVQGVDHLGHELVLFGDLQHGARILVASTVVGG